MDLPVVSFLAAKSREMTIYVKEKRESPMLLQSHTDTSAISTVPTICISVETQER